MRKELRKMRARIAEINTRFKELADVLETEKRALTPEETAEKEALIQEKEVLQLRMQNIGNGWVPGEREALEERAFAEAVAAVYQKRSIPDECQSFVDGNAIVVPLTRADGTPAVQNTASAAPLIPLTIGEIIEPLEKGLILHKVGCKTQYGLVGEWVLPVVAAIEATIEEENAKVADTTINIGSLKPTPKRVALSIPVSNRAIDQSNTVLLDIVRRQISMGLARLLNKWMFSPSRIVPRASDGCFVKAIAAPAVQYDSSKGITWKDAIAVKGAVMKTGVVFDYSGAYVCSATTYAELEATPRDAGSGRMILEDGKINGYPVFSTEFVGDGVLCFGIFSYELVGQFGQMRIIVDPYTGAKENLVYFVLNTDFDMLTVRPEAFAAAVPKTTA